MGHVLGEAHFFRETEVSWLHWIKREVALETVACPQL